jgi:hypothetical protein
MKAGYREVIIKDVNRRKNSTSISLKDSIVSLQMNNELTKNNSGYASICQLFLDDYGWGIKMNCFLHKAVVVM